jgi:hypothetical protein
MRYDRIFLASAAAVMLLTCTSCSVEELDADGDGWITKSELLSAAANAVCSDQGQPADEPPADEPPSDEPPLDEPPTNEPPVDETPGGGTATE